MPDACWLVITLYRRKCCRSGNLYFSYFVYRRSKTYFSPRPNVFPLTNFWWVRCVWGKKEGRIIFLVEWKGTCTSSTLAGCQLIFISVVCELIFISVACEKKRRSVYFPGWVERSLYLLNYSWLPTNLYFLTHRWLIRKKRTMTRWKRTCTSSTLGKQLRCSLVSNFWWVRCLRKKTNGLFLSCIFKVKIFLTEKLLLKQQCNKIASILTVRTYD